MAGGPDGSLLLPLRQTERTTAHLRPTQQVIGVRDQGGGESHKVIYVNSAGALLDLAETCGEDRAPDLCKTIRKILQAEFLLCPQSSEVACHGLAGKPYLDLPRSHVGNGNGPC